MYNKYKNISNDKMVYQGSYHVP